MHGNRYARISIAGLTLLLSPALAFGQVDLPDAAPLPYAGPSEPGKATAIIEQMTTNGAVTAYSPAGMAKRLLATDGAARLESALDALADGEVAEARELRDGLADESIDREILTWAIAVSGDPAVASHEIAAAAHDLEDWPGMASLRAASERALYRENPGAEAVLRAFGDTEPQTVEGAIILARAHVETGDLKSARAVLGPVWRERKLAPRMEAAIIREFGKVIPVLVHRVRMVQMLHHDRITSAERVAGLARADELCAAWAAVTRNQKNAGKLLAAVPGAQRSAGWLFAKARHLRRTGEFREAAEMMMRAPKDAASLIDPDAWWVERRVLSRELLDIDEPEIAYRTAAEHAAESPEMAADAEFHAGWYALRALGEPEKAAPHFRKIAEVAEGPISLARAYYWLGRTAEAGGPGDAASYYGRAARYGTAFYGQLAAAKLGRDTIEIGYPTASGADRREFASREAVRAIRRLEQAGHDDLAYRLYRALAEELKDVGELALLAAMAKRQDNHFLSLKVGKWAAARGLDVGALAHPVGVIPASADISGAGEALAYAIARQESEFRVSVRSGAGALGLLQLLPGTASEMARKAGLDYSKGRLTTDAAYNATLGAAYLGEQLDRFDGSYILTFVGYNAGPSRAIEWMERYGDPRGKDIDTVVDWIERIPFTETRSYVQRVMENYQVYKMRLTGHMSIEDDLVEGR